MTTPWSQKSKENLQHTQYSEKLQAFILSELKQVIKHLNPLKAPGSDLITAHMIREMPPEGLKNLLYIFNAITRLEYWPVPLKHAKIIIIPKPGKKSHWRYLIYTNQSFARNIQNFGETPTQKDIRHTFPGVDTSASIRFPKSAFYYTTVSPAYRYNKQSIGRLTTLLSLFLGCQPKVR